MQWHNWCLEAWRAQSPAGRVQDNETDLYACHKDSLWGATVEENVAFFELPGSKEVWRFRLAVSYPVTSECTSTLYLDALRGGFVSDVGKVEGACSFPLWESIAFAPKLQLSHDTKFDVTAAGFDIGVDWKVHSMTIRPFVEGYQAIIGHGPAHDDFDIGAGLRLSVNGSLNDLFTH